MISDSQARTTVHPRRFSRATGAATILVGSLVLLGWLIDAEPLKAVIPGLVAMKVNTALCFVLCGLCLWLPFTTTIAHDGKTRADAGKP